MPSRAFSPPKQTAQSSGWRGSWRSQVGSTSSSVKLTRSAFAVGDARLIQVLDAERLYQQARLGYVRARAQRLADTTSLFAAVGGAWADWREHERQAPATLIVRK